MAEMVRFTFDQKLFRNVQENITEELINYVLESIVQDVHRAIKLEYFPVKEYNISKDEFFDVADPLDDPIPHLSKNEDDKRGAQYDSTWSDNGSVSWSLTESDIDFGHGSEKDESENLSENELEECMNFFVTEHTSNDDVQGDNEDGDSELDSECNKLDVFNKFNGFVDYCEVIANEIEKYKKSDEFLYESNALVNKFSGHANRYNVQANVPNVHVNGYTGQLNHRFGSGYDDEEADENDSKDKNKCHNKEVNEKGDDEGNNDEDDGVGYDEDDGVGYDEDDGVGYDEDDGVGYDEDDCVGDDDEDDGVGDDDEDDGVGDDDEDDSVGDDEDDGVGDDDEDDCMDDGVGDDEDDCMDDDVDDSKSNSTNANKGDNADDSKDDDVGAYKGDNVSDYKSANKGNNEDNTRNNDKNKGKNDNKHEDIYDNVGNYKSELWNCPYGNQRMAAGRLGLHMVSKCAKKKELSI